MKIGLISDTHGLLRPEALEALAGVDAILHAGDVGSPDVLDSLSEVAPVTAIRGNVDRDPWCAELPETELVELDGVSFYLVHSEDWLELDPAAASVDVVLSGHSHRPSIERRGDVWFVNPGSAGPRRFSLPVTLAVAEIADGVVLGIERIDLL